MRHLTAIGRHGAAGVVGKGKAMRIMLLQGDEPFWERVRSYLIVVNASAWACGARSSSRTTATAGSRSS